MNRFFQSLKTLKFWNNFFENAKWVVVYSYLVDLNRSGNYDGFMLVAIIFGFKPISEWIQLRIKKP